MREIGEPSGDATAPDASRLRRQEISIGISSGALTESAANKHSVDALVKGHDARAT